MENKNEEFKPIDEFGSDKEREEALVELIEKMKEKEKSKTRGERMREKQEAKHARKQRKRS